MVADSRLHPAAICRIPSLPTSLPGAIKKTAATHCFVSNHTLPQNSGREFGLVSAPNLTLQPKRERIGDESQT
jgi:hypothetical protein